MSEQARVQETETKVLKTVTYQVLRYNPESGTAPRLQEYSVPVTKGMTVLDGLTWIKEHLDPTLVWRSSCRMGVCGSCGMFINGLPRLACNNQIMHLHSDQVIIKPLPNYDIIRDLVPDLEGFFAKHRTAKPYLIREELKEQENPTGEYFQSQQELVNYIQFAYCIKCGLCLAACPTVATDEHYLGPQALGQALRYNADSRDEGSGEREADVHSDYGVYRCHFAGACSEVCPKGVDPAFAIQLLKRDMFMRNLRGHQHKSGTAVAPPVRDWKQKTEYPKAPTPTVK
jgi:succinate dehydrogenase / fumarate reductase iron-sulfur subunit